MIEFLIFGPLLGSLIAGFMYRSIGEDAAIFFATSIVIIGAIKLDCFPRYNTSREWLQSYF